MTLVKKDPFDLRTLWRWPAFFDEEELVPAISHQLDVYETDNEVVVKAGMAGVKPENIDISFDKGALWIRGEEEEEKKEGKKFYQKASRAYSYKVAVPGRIDLKKEPQAAIKHGVVTVTFKKAEEAKPKKITVKAA